MDIFSMKKTDPTDIHVVPVADAEAHLYEHADCPCEPKCVFQSHDVRVFLHSSAELGPVSAVLLTTRPPSPHTIPNPDPFLPPGPSEGYV